MGKDFRVTIPKQVRQALGVKTSDYQIALWRLKDRNDPVISEAELLRRLRLEEMNRG